VTGADVVFGLLGVLCLAAGVLVVTVRNVIHAALSLVVCFGALAGCYLVLTAEFVAWVQVLIYIGAVVVLMLFGAMLTRAPIGRVQELDSANRPVAALAGLATAGVLGTLVVSAFRGAYVDIHHTPVGDGHGIGSAIFRFYVLPFEVSSVLLLAALVGAIVLTRGDQAAGDGESR
jgi:NADH-quinone oxidoreductase subunit J